jgi:FkbM family methyltransferase
MIGQFLLDNGITNAAILPVALSDSNGILELYSTNAFDDQASLVGSTRPDGLERGIRTHVPVRVGDELVEELRIEKVAAIKIDVEGAELAVLRGLRRTLERHRPALLFEVLPNFFGADRKFRDAAACEANRAFANELFAMLNDLSYVVKQVSEDGEKPIERFDLDDARGYVGADYLAVTVQPR